MYGDLFQRLDEIRNSLGILGGDGRHGFLVRSLLGIVALGEQIGDLIGGQAGAFEGGTNLALALGTMTTGALAL